MKKMKQIICYLVLGIFLISCGTKGKKDNEKVYLAQVDEQEIAQKPDEISLLFIGDFMGHMDQINAAYNTETKTYEYDNCFSKIKPILSDADLTIGNVEVTLGVKPYSGYPQFSSPPSYAAAIKRAGVDALTTANNHSCDKGKIGVERTIKILDSLEIPHTGTFINPVEKTKNPAYVIHQNNFKIAVINYTYGTNSIDPTPPNVVNYLDKEVIKKDVRFIKNGIQPDEIIAFLHWGDQYKDLPNTAQKDMFAYFKSLGVNIVIGAHPHVLQPMKWNKKDSVNLKESLVVYSLGNFVSHQRTFPRDGGAVFKLSLIKDETDNVKIKDAKYFLTWVYEPIVNDKKEYYVLPADEYSKKPDFFAKKKDYDKMMRFVKHARTLLEEHNVNIPEYY